MNLNSRLKIFHDLRPPHGSKSKTDIMMQVTERENSIKATPFEIIDTTPKDLDIWNAFTFENGLPMQSPKVIQMPANSLRKTPVLPYIPIIEPIVNFLKPLTEEQAKFEALRKENDFNICGAFKIQSANQSINEAKNKPIPKMLFDEFWHEGELCCLFASSNVGKSILAVQIANAISSGQAIKGFRLGTQKQKALYFDFELSPKQFEGRYSQDYGNHYLFDNNFFRVEFDTQMVAPDSITFEEYLNNSIEKAIEMTASKILVIDNLTYLRNETEKSKDALGLMKYLKTLKSKYGLSILVLAHTPKRDFSRPLTQNDLMGSSMLGNFFDSCFTIGASAKDKSMRYIKQIKVRECEKRYDGENVINCQIVKYLNFVEFEVMGSGDEREHLKDVSEKDKTEAKDEAKKLKEEGISNVEIARRFRVSEGAVRKWFKS